MDHAELISKMTDEEKASLCSGADFWHTKGVARLGIPQMMLTDGPHGLRKQIGKNDHLGLNAAYPATCFPTASAAANSWDEAMIEQMGRRLGAETRAQRVGVILGPGVNIKRSPLCGRNFEYYSEDPLLAGKCAAALIRGVQSNGIAACVKHFAANSQETLRMTSDSVMDERTLREIYLPAFEIAVKEGRVKCLMTSYNMLNGQYTNENEHLLQDILTREWGYDGLIVTDWGGDNDRVRGLIAGNSLEMPGTGGETDRQILEAVQSGAVERELLDERVARLLRLVSDAEEAFGNAPGCDMAEHHEFAARFAEECAVLLKNEGGILPLKKDAKIAVIGAMAKKLRYQGAGSSHINPTGLSQPLDFLPDAIYAPGCDDRGDTTEDLLSQAAKTAQEAEIAVIFAGLPDRYESEGFDRADMKMPEGQLRMIDAVTAANPNTVVVLLSGSAVECPWADRVKGILYMGLPGQAGGDAVADLLCGRANPSGKLAESWPLSYADVPSSEIYGKTDDALYEEGLYVGYRYYEKSGVAVRWPFGFGLSYTTFAYSDLTVDGNAVSVAVKNTGSFAGAEVVQLSVKTPQDGLHRPIRELKGFQKIFLEPGQRQTVTFSLTDRSFAVWQDGWKIPAGKYTVCIGGLTASIEKSGETLPIPAWQGGSWYERCTGKPNQTDWEAMLGRTYMPPMLKKGSFTMDNTVMEMKDYSLIMKIMFKAVEASIAKGFGGKKDYEDPEFRMLMNSSAGSPLRSMQISGGMKGGVMPGMLEMANGHFLRGLRRMILG